ncbi:helix-turn-helix transcriptional regulator [uncultured Chryseobacterium sp.]|uniref:helix-turn-helix domain-containing protein n=1 Tax=uncultured Chryseobacterium sp. TaxID=259322 RepID=UPI002611F8FB|nr:helix-turn-helix transcriptional regulator [uncultured Chryseobacterium sp.]
MKMFVKFDFNTLCKKVLEQQLDSLGLKYKTVSFGEVEFLDKITPETVKNLTEKLDDYGIEIIENQKTALVQKIKDAITEMVFGEKDVNVKASVYLAEKLNHSYGYLSNLFSEVTYTSIENFIILQKIEYAKQLIVNNKLTLTEIAYRLSYSSVAHLSTQFKNTTGITPSQFQKIIGKRRELAIKK